VSCWLCGHEKDKAHHLGCARIANPDLTPSDAQGAGLIAAPKEKKRAPQPKVEVLKEGTMTTEPVGEDEPVQEPEESVATCGYPGCDNPKKSDHPRTKYCEEHSDPKNRKE
jgi:hypothetical protein